MKTVHLKTLLLVFTTLMVLFIASCAQEDILPQEIEIVSESSEEVISRGPLVLADAINSGTCCTFLMNARRVQIQLEHV